MKLNLTFSLIYVSNTLYKDNGSAAWPLRKLPATAQRYKTPATLHNELCVLHVIDNLKKWQWNPAFVHTILHKHTHVNVTFKIWCLLLKARTKPGASLFDLNGGCVLKLFLWLSDNTAYLMSIFALITTTTNEYEVSYPQTVLVWWYCKLTSINWTFAC